MSKASTNKRERRSIIQVSLRGPGLAAIARDLRGLAQKVYVCTYMYVYVYVCTCMLCYVCHPRAQKHEAKRATLSIELSRLLESKFVDVLFFFVVTLAFMTGMPFHACLYTEINK